MRKNAVVYRLVFTLHPGNATKVGKQKRCYLRVGMRKLGMGKLRESKNI